MAALPETQQCETGIESVLVDLRVSVIART